LHLTFQYIKQKQKTNTRTKWRMNKEKKIDRQVSLDMKQQEKWQESIYKGFNRMKKVQKKRDAKKLMKESSYEVKQLEATSRRKKDKWRLNFL
jgi:hypothetical protein